jgi:hypothetical protein
MTSAISAPFMVFLSVERLHNPAVGRMGGGADPRTAGSGSPDGGSFGAPKDRYADALRADLAWELVSQVAAAGD